MSQISTLVLKELRVELRSKEALLGSLLMALLILLAFRISFSLQDAPPEAEELAPGIIWAAVIFAGLGLFSNTFRREVDRKTLEALTLEPVSRANLYLGKLVGNLILLYALELLIALAFVALFGNPFHGEEGKMMLILILGGLGFAAVATLMGALTALVESAWLLLPLLTLPIVAKTILEMSVAATTYLIQGNDAYGYSLVLLGIFDLAFILTGMVLADHTL